MRQHRRTGVSFHAAAVLSLAILATLYSVGDLRAAIVRTSPTVTKAVMLESLKAIHYPFAHSKNLSCVGLGTVAKGGHTSFRCAASLRGGRERRFYARIVGKGGWLCAGRGPSDCRLLPRGFFASGAADSQGWQQTAVLGWLQARQLTPIAPRVRMCTGTRSPMTCTLRKSPPVTVIISYEKTGAGYVETARRR